LWFDFHSLLNKWNHFFFCVLLLMMLLLVVVPLFPLFSTFGHQHFLEPEKRIKNGIRSWITLIFYFILPFLFIRLDDCNGPFPSNAPTEDEIFFLCPFFQRNSLIYFVLLSTSLSILWTIDLLLLKFIFFYFIEKILSLQMIN